MRALVVGNTVSSSVHAVAAELVASAPILSGIAWLVDDGTNGSSRFVDVWLPGMILG